MRAHITIALHRLTLHGISTNGMMIITITDKQGRSYGGISVYIPPKSVYLTNFYVVTGCFDHMWDINMF